jgi:hypothetical protein
MKEMKFRRHEWLEWKHWEKKGNEKPVVATINLQGTLIKTVPYVGIHLNIISFTEIIL